jgi:hypothetical protein
MPNKSEYNHAYYLAHREAMLTKGRAWAKEHPERIRELARYRRGRRWAGPFWCVDCGAPVMHALRCRRCYLRHRYQTDPEYRARRAVIMRASHARRGRQAGQPKGGDDGR